MASSEQIEAWRRQAKAELPPRLAELAARYGFAYNRVTIKHNATNWGSCSAKSNINLNLNIVRLPKVLQDYVLLHELCHLRHQDHGHAFHLLLEHVLTDNLMRLLDSAALPAGSSEQTVPTGSSMISADQLSTSVLQNANLASDLAFASDLARKAASSKARYPLDYTMTRAIKQYRVI